MCFLWSLGCGGHLWWGWLWKLFSLSYFRHVSWKPVQWSMRCFDDRQMPVIQEETRGVCWKQTLLCHLTLRSAPCWLYSTRTCSLGLTETLFSWGCPGCAPSWYVKHNMLIFTLKKTLSSSDCMLCLQAHPQTNKVFFIILLHISFYPLTTIISHSPRVNKVACWILTSCLRGLFHRADLSFYWFRTEQVGTEGVLIGWI